MLFAWITDPNAWLALGTLTLLEIVLGIDNIIFLSLVVAKLPTAQRAHARRLGLMGAMFMRLGLLASIAWVVKLTNPLFTVFDQAISLRDLILLLGGLFLIWKASKEIHESIEGDEESLKTNVHSFLGAIVCWPVLLFTNGVVRRDFRWPSFGRKWVALANEEAPAKRKQEREAVDKGATGCHSITIR